MNSTSTLEYIGTESETSAQDFLLSSLGGSSGCTSGPYSNERNATSLMKVTANGLCAIIAISTATYVQPIIDDKSVETFITPVNAINSVSSISTQEIEIPIKTNNSELVQSFLLQNPELAGQLNLLTSAIPDEFQGSSVIEYYQDIEEHWEKLFLIIDTGIDDFDELEKIEDQLYSKLIVPLAPAIQEKIVLTVS
ncbi:hypothetical protein [Saccharophagus degradans]|uniref:Uncharacterized protein n=1 Tax=Saccharophagus degradans TaxID=86304 RepID=A0AAW7X5M1_9GAMM|nr:hypothetical protein [Saccharophagus degradans]MDO6422882.1 hypothetical protein [Saccharophagus degradans]MDO6609303.1 hypothetical protein [Saccharophagus degradans]